MEPAAPALSYSSLPVTRLVSASRALRVGFADLRPLTLSLSRRVPRRQATPTGGAARPWEETMDSFARLARTHCSDCGRSGLVWYSAKELAFHLRPSERKGLFDLMGFTGGTADAWLCKGCRAWGVWAPHEFAF